MKLPSSSQMRSIDQCAINEFGIPGVVLMENAGLGTVRMMEKQLGSCQGTFVCIFVGPGNNGGDGLVIGRHLYQQGCTPLFFFLVNPDEIKGDAAVNLEIVRNLKLPFYLIENDFSVETITTVYNQLYQKGLNCYAVVDSIFGIGLDREVKDRFKDTIDLINSDEFAPGVPVVSADIPSGLDADSGNVHGTAVYADFTATYGCAKPGHFNHEAKRYCGEVTVVDIGIPDEVIEQKAIRTELVTAEKFSAITSTFTRTVASHKGSHGHVLIFAGSTGKTGAAILAARGALRGGSGLVSLCCPDSINPVLESNLVEAMTIVLPSGSKTFAAGDIDFSLKNLEGKDAVVIGPGMGTDKDTEKFVLGIYRKVTIPLVVDADGLNILANNPTVITETVSPKIFTPHPGELSRLLGCSVKQIQADRIAAVKKACEVLNSDDTDNIIVLKGAGTLIGSRYGTMYINSSGNPGMATGGMGDVLSGLIASYLGQGLSPLDAAVAGVYLHGAAADYLYKKMGPGYSATEVADMIPKAQYEISL